MTVGGLLFRWATVPTRDELTTIFPPREPSATTGTLAIAAEVHVSEIQQALGRRRPASMVRDLPR